MLVAHDKGTGTWVEPGDPITSFRGERAMLVACTRANSLGRDGKVTVSWLDGTDDKHEYNAGAFNLIVTEHTPGT